MRVLVNGEGRELPDAATVAEAVALVAEAADPAAPGVAVALDGDVVPRTAWSATPLREGQRVEVVRAVQGG